MHTSHKTRLLLVTITLFTWTIKMTRLFECAVFSMWCKKIRNNHLNNFRTFRTTSETLELLSLCWSPLDGCVRLLAPIQNDGGKCSVTVTGELCREEPWPLRATHNRQSAIAAEKMQSSAWALRAIWPPAMVEPWKFPLRTIIKRSLSISSMDVTSWE